MKKLLILVLVLGIVSAASASIVLVPSSSTVNPGDTITMTIETTASEQVATINVGIIRDGDNATGATTVGTLNTAFVTADNGYTGTGLGLGDDAGDIGYITGAVNLPTYATGVLYTYTYTVSNSATPGAINFTLPDTSGDPYYLTSGVTLAGSEDIISISGASVQVVPEPMTIALLGLGGLFLRRKK